MHPRSEDPRDLKRPLAMGGLAFVAVMAAHHLAYRLAAPDPHYRAELLHATGHRYFTYLTALALGLLVAGLTTFLRTGTEERSERPARFAYAAPRLLVAQVGGFLALEVLERTFVGHGAGALLTEKPVLIGLALQLLVAIVGAISLCLVAFVIGRIRARLPDLGRAATTILFPRSRPLAPRALLEAGSASPRGPPSY